MKTRPECVICGKECPVPRHTYCSRACSDVMYAPRHRRTVRQHVQRELFMASEAYARSEERSADVELWIEGLRDQLADLIARDAGHGPIAPLRQRTRSEQHDQLALPGVR